MKITVDSNTLLKHLQPLKGILPSNPVIPVLENVLVECDGSTMKFTASDLQTAITTTVDNNSDVGEFLAPKLFIDTVSQLKDQLLTIEVDEHHVIIKGEKNGSYKVATENSEDYPRTPEITSGKGFVIPEFVLKTALQSLKVTASTDKFKPAMNGVVFQNLGNGLSLTSTDAHRLTNFEIDVDCDSDLDIIISSVGIRAIDSILSNSEFDVNIDYNDSIAVIKNGSVSITTRLLDENFPKWQQIIPSSSDTFTKFNRVDLIKTLNRVSIFSNKVTNLVKIDILHSNCEISAENIDFGNAGSEIMDCESNKLISIGFDAKALTGILNTVQGDEIIFEMTDPNRTVLIKGSNSGYTGLIMPVMLSNY